MKLSFITPGSVVEGTLSSVEVNTRGNNSFLEMGWLVGDQTIRESHFMTNYDEIVENLSKVGLDINTDTDTWLGTPAKLLVESNNGYLNATIVGPAEHLKMDTDPTMDYSAKEEGDLSSFLDD